MPVDIAITTCEFGGGCLLVCCRWILDEAKKIFELHENLQLLFGTHIVVFFCKTIFFWTICGKIIQKMFEEHGPKNTFCSS